MARDCRHHHAAIGRGCPASRARDAPAGRGSASAPGQCSTCSSRDGRRVGRRPPAGRRTRWPPKPPHSRHGRSTSSSCSCRAAQPHRHLRPQAAAQQAPRPAAAAERHPACSCSSRRWMPPSSARRRRSRSAAESGLEIADTYPHLQKCADDLAVVRSCHHESFNHAPAQYMLNTGTPGWAGRAWARGSPTAWAANRKPAGVRGDGRRPATSKAGRRSTATASCRARISPRCSATPARPCSISTPPASARATPSRRERARHGRSGSTASTWRPGADVDDLSSRIASYELAFRMQARGARGRGSGPRDRGDQAALRAGRPISAKFGADCLIARRLVERGVRFVQIFTGSAGADDWDAAHAENDKTHRDMARMTDRPIAGLLDGPEGARLARGHAGDLGRRVRPHARRRRPIPRQARRPRPQPLRLHRSGWPAAGSRGARSSAPPTNSASAPSRTACTSTTCTPRSSSCSAWTTAS